jgi:hypothetical protein
MRTYLLGVVLTGAISPPVVEVLEICGSRDPLRGNYSEKKAASQHGQRQTRRSILLLQLNKMVPWQAAGVNPGEVLRKPSEHRFRPAWQTPRIGVWVKDKDV